MKQETVLADITVIGGGLAGVCAAIAAARLGQTVTLVQNRPVLGGNSSSEVRVWVCGATAHGINRYARETGVMGELLVENQYRNPEGNPYLWDLTVLEAVRAEKNIQLFLNTDVHEVEADGEKDNRIIHSVSGWMMGSERWIRFESQVFLDCTGDGLVGFLAGAEYRLGREAKHEFQEDWAPEVADEITLGSTLLFYTKDTGRPVKFIPPSFAKDITQTLIPIRRIIQSGDSGCHYWWIEWGGELDTVHENERIRDELWSVIYGIWDYIKNSGEFDADMMTLEWVGSLPGKREYRRFIGEYVLNQNDIMSQEPFEDRIAFGGWSIDLHPPQGIYASESGSKHLYADGIYHIPFRSLYSKNVTNLLFAGRNISASHVAFGTTRVMATCAVIGEAAGAGAAMCVQNSITPRDLRLNRMTDLQQMMLRQGASIIGLRNVDQNDLALVADASASSIMKQIRVVASLDKVALEADVGLLFPVDGGLEAIEILVGASSITNLEVELWDTGKLENYIPFQLQNRAIVPLTHSGKAWVSVPLIWKPEVSQNAFVIIKANHEVTLFTSDQPVTGVLSFIKGQTRNVSTNSEDPLPAQPVVQWSMESVVRKAFCFTMRTQAYHPNKVIDGYSRPFGGPHSWVSEPIRNNEDEWLQLNWNQPIDVAEIHLTFNDDVNEDLINLHHHRTTFPIIPELVKDYSIEVWADGQWSVVFQETNNRKRKRVHRLDNGVSTDRIRVVIHSTNGSERAEIVEVRVYQ